MTESKRVCYIHIGTHKTGTTSIQRFLALNSIRFAAAGLVVPRAGGDNWPKYASHHHFASELTNGAPFRSQSGVEALAKELRDSTARVACVSSENLSLLWNNPDGLVRLRDTVIQSGFTPKIVCYVRPQASYSTSVYAQIVCNGGYRRPFHEFLNDVLTHGHYIRGSTIAAPFEYSRLLDPFAEVFGHAAIVARRYRSGAPDKALLVEFSRLLLGPDAPSDLVVPHVRENGSLDFKTVLTFLGEPVSSSDPIRFSPLTVRQVVRFDRRFRHSNADFARRYGVKLPAFEPLDVVFAFPFRRNGSKARALAAARRALARHGDSQNRTGRQQRPQAQ